MSAATFTANVPMDLGKQLSYEKRLAELESQIQALINWKKMMLETLAAVIRPTVAVPTLVLRNTTDFVPTESRGSMKAARLRRPAAYFAQQQKKKVEDILLRATSDKPIIAEPQELKITSAQSPAKALPAAVQPLSPQEVAHEILDVLQEYGKHTGSPNEGQAAQKWLGRGMFFPRVERYVQSQQPVKMILPSFPWKSINRVDKVTGALPDLGEDLALARLNALCLDIGKVYEHGAEVHIATDGLVFNDVVGISDEDTWNYSVALMEMAATKNFTQIKLLRVMDFLGYTDDDRKNNIPLTKEKYMSLVDRTRRELEAQFGDPDKDVRGMIKTDSDTLMTYRGFIRFLETDLRHSPVASSSRGASGHAYRRVVKEVAMKMMTRAESFTKIIQAKCPDYVRLSIHPSSGAVKLSVPLLVEKVSTGGCGFPRTPWHSSIAVGVDGSYRAVHASDVRETHELVARAVDGRPWCFREKSELFDLGAGVEIEHLYPCGIEVRPTVSRAVGEYGADITPCLSPTAREKLEKLAEMQPVKVVGFVDAPQF